MGSVNGKVALITGGANGIGAEVARRLHDKGAKLVLTDVDEALLKEVASRLGEDRVLTVVADVRDFAAMQAAIDKGIERFGGIDIVMANAGIATYRVGAATSIPAAFKTLLDVNVVGVFHTVRAALPSVIERRGYVLVVSSLGGIRRRPGLAPYNLAKAGVEHFANALRLEVAHLGVDVGSAHMSWIDTPLVREGEGRICRPSARCIDRLPGPMNKTDLGGEVRRGVRQGNRGPQAPDQLPALGGRVPMAASVADDLDRRDAITEVGLPKLLAQMDAEVAALGRSMSERTEGLENR